MAVNGSWQLESTDDVAAFYMKLGIPEANLEKVKNLNRLGASGPTEVLKVTGDVLKMKVLRPDGVVAMENEAKLGEEKQVTSLDGRDVKVTMTIDGDKYVRHEKGETFDCTWTRSVSGDTMTMVMQSGPHQCNRKYKRVA